ncbi:MAG: hypothetical protein SV686_12525 [Thermodesulfobacteriota bacterium]|jgi:hypothetical protein|nr:hypothetical protein [Thermodesulfobacteriota bacterium]
MIGKGLPVRFQEILFDWAIDYACVIAEKSLFQAVINIHLMRP